MMPHTAVPAPARSFRAEPFALTPAARRSEPAPARQAAARQATARQAAMRQAAERERRRLARELHDGAIQEVLAAGLAIDLCLAEAPAGSPARASLEHARRLTASALRRLRSSLQTLREGADATGEELPDMLRRLQARHPLPQLEVSMEVTGPPEPLAASARRWLFQVASECVFNAAVHGGARRAVIRLGYRRGAVMLCVADDGRGQLKTVQKILRGGVPGAGGGYHLGLADIAARAAEMGGTLRADRSELGGIAVQVLMPIANRGEAGGDSDG